ncbi:L-arabinose transporter permease protein [Serratia fonticola]|uniref:L-arabinose transporter permease protein n=1 Tax=Serratia fonticola TaxID=47917 RepID=A0A4U9WA80_SERFO|nr:L-arabinose transporter permease protein [Serratia fonticola]
MCCCWGISIFRWGQPLHWWGPLLRLACRLASVYSGVPLSIMAALVLGLVNGSLTALAGIPSFIVTVATMGIFRGIAYIVTDGTPIMIKSEAFLALGNGEFLYIPIPIWILLVLLIVNHFILSKTTFGARFISPAAIKRPRSIRGLTFPR